MNVLVEKRIEFRLKDVANSIIIRCLYKIIFNQLNHGLNVYVFIDSYVLT